jgi:thioredoxin-related protein
VKRTLAVVVVTLGVLSVGAADTARAAENGAVNWVDYRTGLILAAEQDKPLLVNFTADWCKFCKRMKAETYADPAVIDYLNERFVAAMVDTEVQQDIARQYYVRGLPTIWFLTGQGEKITNLPGYVDAPTFLQILGFIASEAYRSMTFSDYVASVER